MKNLFPFFLLLLFSYGCIGNKSISHRGLKYAQIGMEMPEAGIKNIKGHAVRDTVFDQGGYQWRASVLTYKKGKVYIEEDFIGGNTIGRIRIHTSELQFKKEFGVGMAVEELQNISSIWDIYYLSNYQLLDFTCHDFPEIHFLVKDPKYNGEKAINEEIQLNDLANTSKVVAIVVM